MNTPSFSDYSVPALKTTGKRKRSSLSSTPEPSHYNQNIMQNVIIKVKYSSYFFRRVHSCHKDAQKQKACLNCRRSKLKCVVDEEHGGACVRCLTRNEECRFKSRTHVRSSPFFPAVFLGSHTSFPKDDEWQETTSNRLEVLSQAVSALFALCLWRFSRTKSLLLLSKIEQLSYSMQMVMQHLNLNPPQMMSLPVPQAQLQQHCAPMHQPQARISAAPSYLPMPERAQLMQPWPSPPTSLDERFPSPSLSPEIMPVPPNSAFASNTDLYDDYFSAVPSTHAPQPHHLAYPTPMGGVLGVYNDNGHSYDDDPCAPTMNFHMNNVPQHFIGVNGNAPTRHQQ
jgi:hypothetical protein